MQSTPNHRPSSIRLEASNYGPIVDAKVDLRPLTVFVGPSNTGKSYLAILTYALHRLFSGASPIFALECSAEPSICSMEVYFGNTSNRWNDNINIQS